MDIERRTQILQERLRYVQDIFGHKENENINLMADRLDEFKRKNNKLPTAEQAKQLADLEDLFLWAEKKLDRDLTAMDKVRIVRHPQRTCLKDILEHVYDNYTEVGGQEEYSIDPSMVIARAYITRRTGKKVHHQPVMVIGQEKGHGQEFRNGGSVKPWGNANALHYMKVAETENIPIHTYVFTPGSYPIEDYPGAAQQIARNLYAMAGLTVPIITVFSEGGSGGAEAIGLSDRRLMLSHGYYSVISPEGAAAIEGRIRQGQRAPAGLVESCAENLKITADDNLCMGYVDRVIQEPPLGARPDHFDFYRELRQEIIRATDEVVLNVKGIQLFRAMALRRHRKAEKKPSTDLDNIYVRWNLDTSSRERLLDRRYMKFMRMSRHLALDKRSASEKLNACVQDVGQSVFSFLRYDFFRKHQKKVENTVHELGAEIHVVWEKLFRPVRKVYKMINRSADIQEQEQQLTQLSEWKEEGQNGGWQYVSARAKEDRAITCPNADTHGCLDLWAPDLFGDFAGVCSYCGHHFPMEHTWYLENVFDQGSIKEFNAEIEAGNPLDYPGLDDKVDQAKKKLNMKSGCMTFEARIDGVRVVVAMLCGGFRGGSVGSAEGEKFIRAADRARTKHYPFLAYVHGTAGIRIQEGVNGVIQMPRCTMAVRRYIDEGGLYLVLYDTNSYAGPVASFLGCSPYQFSVRSANIGFAGPGVIKETTGMEIPPDYHRAYSALSRGHIQGIWDRRDVRKNLYQAILTMGGRNLYYR